MLQDLKRHEKNYNLLAMKAAGKEQVSNAALKNTNNFMPSR